MSMSYVSEFKSHWCCVSPVTPLVTDSNKYNIPVCIKNYG